MCLCGRAAHNYKLMQLTGSTMNKVIANVLWNWNEFAGQFWHFVIERIRRAMSRRKSGHESQHFPKFTHSRKCLPIFRRKVCDCVGDPFPFFLGGAMHVLTSAIGCGLTFNAARNRWLSPVHSPPTFFPLSPFSLLRDFPLCCGNFCRIFGSCLLLFLSPSDDWVSALVDRKCCKWHMQICCNLPLDLGMLYISTYVPLFSLGCSWAVFIPLGLIDRKIST